MRGRYGYADRATRVGLWLARTTVRLACLVAIAATWLAAAARAVAALAADTVQDLIASSTRVMDPSREQERDEPPPGVIDGDVLAVHDTHPQERSRP